MNKIQIFIILLFYNYHLNNNSIDITIPIFMPIVTPIIILVIGSGGREAVILKKLKVNKDVKLYCMGTNKNPTILGLDVSFEYFKDTQFLIEYCKSKRINYKEFS